MGFALLMEVCDTDLERLNLSLGPDRQPLNQKVKLTWEMRLSIMRKVAEGMAYMHDEGVHHYDFNDADFIWGYAEHETHAEMEARAAARFDGDTAAATGAPRRCD